MSAPFTVGQRVTLSARGRQVACLADHVQLVATVTKVTRPWIWVQFPQGRGPIAYRPSWLEPLPPPTPVERCGACGTPFLETRWRIALTHIRLGDVAPLCEQCFESWWGMITDFMAMNADEARRLDGLLPR
jgi:hypothetical protein